MAHKPQIKIPATYMRGGTSKGVFFRLQDLPEAARVPGAARDALLMRVIGSPDPYGKQIDGMGGATSSTSKTVIIAKSSKPDHDVDYLFGQVSIDKAFVDWSGNCGNLSAAVGRLRLARVWSMQAGFRMTVWLLCASGRRISARRSSGMCVLPMAPCKKRVTLNSTA
jgi:Uncharacterized protein conserved in bacteria